jgi:putative DNA primase/helicase
MIRMPVDNIMAAALFRTIELQRPTLLLDEADTYLSNNEDLRCIINSGHRRNGQVIRCVGDDHEPRQFSTWAPVLLAQIGNPPATIHDRSIVITLIRKKPSEQVQRFREEQRIQLHVLARKAARWAHDNADAISRACPPSLDYINDRANDNWMPLLAIADRAGGPWPRRARNAAHALAETAGHDASSTGEMLLPDIQSILDQKLAGEPGGALRDRISSVELSAHLATLEGRPWAEWKSGLPITPNALARLLRTFSVSSGTIRLESGQTLKGYMRRDFDDVFERYGLSRTVTPSQANNDRHFRAFGTVTDGHDVTVRNSQKLNNDGLCDGVTVVDATRSEDQC